MNKMVSNVISPDWAVEVQIKVSDKHSNKSVNKIIYAFALKVKEIFEYHAVDQVAYNVGSKNRKRVLFP